MKEPHNHRPNYGIIEALSREDLAPMLWYIFFMSNILSTDDSFGGPTERDDVASQHQSYRG